MAKKKYSAKEMSDFRAKRIIEEAKEDVMKGLMEKALDRFDTDKLLEMFQSVCINKNIDCEFVGRIKELLSYGGYAVIKVDTISDEFELRKFCSALIPNVNEFENKCLFN